MKTFLVVAEQAVPEYSGKILTRTRDRTDTFEEARLSATRIAAREEHRVYIAEVIGYYEPVYDPEVGWHRGID